MTGLLIGMGDGSMAEKKQTEFWEEAEDEEESRRQHTGEEAEDEEESSRQRAREEATEALLQGIRSGNTGEEEMDELLWKAVLAYQKELFYTSSGLPFSYTVKRKKNGAYSGELEVFRKEGSKTLTRSSVLLAFHKVLERIQAAESDGETGGTERAKAGGFVPPRYKGPKAIGQIFGISYVYSLFWKIGLIQVPPKVEGKLKGERETEGADPCGTGKFIIMEDGRLIY